MRQAYIAVLLVALAGHCIASQDKVATWDDFTARALVHGKPVTVTARVSSHWLVALSVESSGKRIEVPPSELADLFAPQLHSVQVLYGTFYAVRPLPGKKLEPEWLRDRPYYYIRLKFGEPKEFDRTAHFHEVTFLFYEDEYKERQIRWVEGRDQWRYETKRPGRPSEQHGVERVLGNVKD